MKSFTTVIFDFDRTLAKLDVKWPLLINNIKKLLPQSIADNFFPIDTKIEFYLNNLKQNNLSQEKISELHKKIENIRFEFEEKAIKTSFVYPDSYHIIDFLNTKNIKTGIHTANFTQVVQEVIKNSKLKFNGPIIGRDLVKMQKPNPEGAVKLLSLLQTPPAKVVMIGDSDHDILIGKNQGFKTYLINRDSKGHFSTKPDKIISSLKDLINDD